MKQMIIGIAGQAGAGKDTIADVLAREYGFTKVAFADALRLEICDAFGIHLDKLVDRASKETPCTALSLSHCRDHRFSGVILASELSADDTGPESAEACINRPRSPRWAMQKWGTEFRRATCGEDYWVCEMAERLSTISGPVVISDVREDIECEFISMHGGEIWRVIRPGLEPVIAHSSEKPLEDSWIDRVISNNSSLEKLSLSIIDALGMAIKAQRGELAA